MSEEPEYTNATIRRLWHGVGYRYEVDVDEDDLVRVRYFDQPKDRRPGQELTIPKDAAVKVAEMIRLTVMEHP